MMNVLGFHNPRFAFFSLFFLTFAPTSLSSFSQASCHFSSPHTSIAGSHLPPPIKPLECRSGREGAVRQQQSNNDESWHLGSITSTEYLGKLLSFVERYGNRLSRKRISMIPKSRPT